MVALLSTAKVIDMQFGCTHSPVMQINILASNITAVFSVFISYGRVENCKMHPQVAHTAAI
jgi:hypothetical protein